MYWFAMGDIIAIVEMVLRICLMRCILSSSEFFCAFVVNNEDVFF